METIGKSFLEGYGYAVGERGIREAEERLEQVPVRFRGFAYEGAGMGCTVLDALPGSSGRRLAALLDGRGADHIYMVYVGMGWAMARLPRPLWPNVRGTDPLLRWLILDGYGFHQAYFRTDRYVHEHRPPRPRWDGGTPDYLPHAVDQGVGRALWFVGGTDPDRVAALIEGFAADRRADLYSGAGLAATYAGGAEQDELRQLWHRAGSYRPQLLQGSAFAAEARLRAGLMVPHTAAATEVLCGMAPEKAAQLCTGLRPTGDRRAEGRAYETWRRRVADEFLSLGRC